MRKICGYLQVLAGFKVFIRYPGAVKGPLSVRFVYHFNAGFAQGQLLGLDPEACLCLGVCTSGHFVRTAQSPTLEDLERFLEKWE